VWGGPGAAAAVHVAFRRRADLPFAKESHVMSHLAQALIAAAAVAGATAVSGQTTVRDAWIHSTTAQQKATGVFAQITARAGGRLAAASSPVAGAVEIHEMVYVSSGLRMRTVPGVALPAGQTIDLNPAGHHLMLMDLKRLLKPGDLIPVTLVIEGPDGTRERIDVQATVKPAPEGKKP
jgi:copper(I)-binding protein